MNDRYYNVKTAIDDIDIAKQITKSLLEKKLVCNLLGGGIMNLKNLKNIY